MSNDFFNVTGSPSQSAALSSAVVRSELVSIQAGFAKLPPLGGNGLNFATINSAGTGMTSLTAAQALAVLGIVIPRGALAGLTLSTAGGSPTMSIAAGQATDSTNVASMSTAAFTKGTAAWAVGTGNGGKMSAAALAAGWYHFYQIMRVDTGLVDIGFDVSATAPTMPANYTLFRRIGSAKSDGTNWLAFIQDGDLFQWLTPVADISTGANPGISAVTRTLASVPTGLNVLANVLSLITNGGAGGTAFSYLSDLSTVDMTPSITLSDTVGGNTAAGGAIFTPARISVRTNTSAQIRSRLNFSDANVSCTINTLGWIDRRGRDA